MRSLKAAAKRKRRLWVFTAIAGLLLGAALHVVLPREFSAKSEVYLVEPAGSDANTVTANELALLQSTAVASAAAQTLDINPIQLSHYSGSVLAPSVLGIAVSASSESEAIREGSAITKAFLTVRAAKLHQQITASTSYLSANISSLQAQIQTWTAQLATATPSQATVLDGQIGNTATIIHADQGQIDQTLANLASVTEGSSIISAPSVQASSLKKTAIKDGAAGLVGGLGAGLLIVVIALLLSDRPKDRSAIAAALGASVDLTVGPIGPRRWSKSRWFSRQLDDPSPDIRRIEQQLRLHVPSPAGALSVVEIEAAEAGAIGVCRVAQSLASSGRRVLIVDSARSRPLSRRFGGERDEDGVCHVSLNGHDVLFCSTPEISILPAPRAAIDRCDVVLILTTVDPALGSHQTALWAKSAVVIVKAGEANGGRIESIGALLRNTQVEIRSAIVVGSDRHDETSGFSDLSGQAQDSEAGLLGSLETAET
jgi:hypothetical protein